MLSQSQDESGKNRSDKQLYSRSDPRSNQSEYCLRCQIKMCLSNQYVMNQTIIGEPAEITGPVTIQLVQDTNKNKKCDTNVSQSKPLLLKKFPSEKSSF